jgi:hypothetical protein
LEVHPNDGSGCSLPAETGRSLSEVGGASHDENMRQTLSDMARDYDERAAAASAPDEPAPVDGDRGFLPARPLRLLSRLLRQ